jgi:hypothetical protein
MMYSILGSYSEIVSLLRAKFLFLKSAGGGFCYVNWPLEEVRSVKRWLHEGENLQLFTAWNFKQQISDIKIFILVQNFSIGPLQSHHNILSPTKMHFLIK